MAGEHPVLGIDNPTIDVSGKSGVFLAGREGAA